MGFLKVNGMIDLGQFWPENQSDGDTIKVSLEAAFLFQTYPNQQFRETSAFDNAEVRGKAVLHMDQETGGNSITIRVQGIDAPELHYQPQAPENLKQEVAAHRAAFHQYVKDYRQPYGETATVQLSKWLRDTYSQQQLPCIVTTQVDTPNDVFDVYGRFIGTIYIPDDNGNGAILDDDGQTTVKVTDVNLHCIEQGWAFPTFYSSMTVEEITPLLQAAKHAQKQNIGVWQFYQNQIGTLDTSLVFDRPTKRHHPVYTPAQDGGATIFPKLFRRLCVYTALSKANIISMSFKEYLQKERDYCFLLQEFVEQGLTASTPHPFDEFIDDGENLTQETYDLIFQEKPSSLRDKNTGQIIKNWW